MRAAARLDSQVSLRRFVPEDAPFVASLAARAFAEYSKNPARYTQSVTERPDTRTWLAIEAGAPVGLVVLEPRGREAAVLVLAVTERERGRGIGGLLMQAAERDALAQGAQLLTLCTADANLAALDLFLRRGFRIVRRRPGFYSRKQTGCELEKKLTQPGVG